MPLLLVLFLVKGIKPIIRHSFMPNRYSKCSLTTLVIKLLYPRAYKLIAQTQEMKNLMIDFYNLNPKKISVLNNPIDTIAINEGIKDNNPYLSYTESFNLVTVGNVRFVKGHDILIKAFKLFKDVYENSHLFIIGQFNPTAKYFIEMQNWIDENNLNNYIHFTGFSNNPYKYIYNSSCFVLPSRSEGLPNVLLEAMYLKKPIVATKCIPFIEQVIEDGINGFKVDVDNEIQMADAMIKAVDMDVKESNKYTPATVNEICEIFK